MTGKLPGTAVRCVARCSLSLTYMNAGDTVGALRAMGGQIGKWKGRMGYKLCGECAKCFLVIDIAITNGMGRVANE
jgi:hypothetical protein